MQGESGHLRCFVLVLGFGECSLLTSVQMSTWALWDGHFHPFPILNTILGSWKYPELCHQFRGKNGCCRECKEPLLLVKARRWRMLQKGSTVLIIPFLVDAPGWNPDLSTCQQGDFNRFHESTLKMLVATHLFFTQFRCRGTLRSEDENCWEWVDQKPVRRERKSWGSKGPNPPMPLTTKKQGLLSLFKGYYYLRFLP